MSILLRYFSIYGKQLFLMGAHKCFSIHLYFDENHRPIRHVSGADQENWIGVLGEKEGLRKKYGEKVFQ